MQVAIRTRNDPMALVSPLRAALRDMDPAIPFAELATMQAIVTESLEDVRVVTLSLTVFSAMALLVALLGIYAVLAYHVSQRAHELSVRLALGATGWRLAGQVVAQGMGLVAAGVVLGLGGSLVATGVLRSLLFQTEATDTGTLAAVIVFVVLATLLASLLPAWRVTRLNAVDALQAE
jgi:ABC-type antimicrobial peptide transport system permease subunit